MPRFVKIGLQRAQVAENPITAADGDDPEAAESDADGTVIGRHPFEPSTAGILFADEFPSAAHKTDEERGGLDQQAFVCHKDGEYNTHDRFYGAIFAPAPHREAPFAAVYLGRMDIDAVRSAADGALSDASLLLLSGRFHVDWGT